MSSRSAVFASLHARPVVVLAHLGAALLVWSLSGCGGTTGTADDGGPDGGASGGAASGGSASGGTASGGSASGGEGVGGGGGVGVGGTGGSGTGGTTAVCPGVAPLLGTQCRSQIDCQNGGQCMAEQPSGAGLCGACFPTYEECTADEECDDGEICFTEPADNCQCMGGDKVCAPACTSTSCGEGQVCGEDGHCTAASCVDDGFACADDRICDPQRGGADGHGCAPRSCDQDAYACPAMTVCDDGQFDEVGQFSDAHGCRPLTCGEGMECPANMVCNPEGPGCVFLTCTTDADCDCGACVFGSCASRPNICVVLPA